jgi:hypothetical protein
MIGDVTKGPMKVIRTTASTYSEESHAKKIKIKIRQIRVEFLLFRQAEFEQCIPNLHLWFEKSMSSVNESGLPWMSSWLSSYPPHRIAPAPSRASVRRHTGRQASPQGTIQSGFGLTNRIPLSASRSVSAKDAGAMVRTVSRHDNSLG